MIQIPDKRILVLKGKSQKDTGIFVTVDVKERQAYPTIWFECNFLRFRPCLELCAVGIRVLDCQMGFYDDIVESAPKDLISLGRPDSGMNRFAEVAFARSVRQIRFTLFMRPRHLAEQIKELDVKECEVVYANKLVSATRALSSVLGSLGKDYFNFRE